MSRRRSAGRSARRRSSRRRGGSSRCARRASRWRALARRARRARRRGRARFAAALARTDRVNVIAECKRRSPSRGVLRADYDPVAIATRLRGGRRGGDFGADRADVLRRLARAPARRCAPRSTCRCCARTSSSSEYQLLEARAAGADAVLLIVAALRPAELTALHDHARRRSASTCWSRCTTRASWRSRIDAGARIIGVNNRNLRTLEVDVARVGDADRADAARTSSRSARAG